MCNPNKWNKLRSNIAQAQDILDYYRIYYPPIHIHSIVQGMGIEITKEDLGENIGAIEINSLNDANIKINIFQNDERAFHLSRFIIAHELAHLMLHNINKYHEDKMDNIINPRLKIDIEANNFAADLIMPQGMFLPVLGEAKYNLKETARVFNTSEAAARMRARQFGFEF